MKLSSLLKALKSKLVVTGLAAILTAGCGPDRVDVQPSDHVSRFMNNITISAGTEFTDVEKIQIPKEFGNIPPHPDDLNKLYGPDHPCKTREVKLRSGEYNADSFAIEFSPFVDDWFEDKWLENIKVGYKGTYVDTGVANQVRDGLSAMEWYEYGAYAGTYSRVSMTNTCHSLRFSWRQPLKLRDDIEIFVQPGMSYDSWSGEFEVQGGWDRYYREQPMLRDSFSPKKLWNPFIKVGIIGYDGAEMGEIKKFSLGLNFFWEPERIEGKTRYGPVNIRGETWGFEGVLAF